ncbi:MAG: hypothetical protein WD824_21340, partial [Cyclobacteriaceae bacterium]
IRDDALSHECLILTCIGVPEHAQIEMAFLWHTYFLRSLYPLIKAAWQLILHQMQPDKKKPA